MARYAAELKRAVGADMQRLKAQGVPYPVQCANLRAGRDWPHRDDDRIPQGMKPKLVQALGSSPSPAKLVATREELSSLWTRTDQSVEQLVAELQA
jgi:stearoyl-CoA desaturase (delta-9 desaturase)